MAAIAREKTQDLLGQIEKRKELRDLSSNPLLLNMLANYHRFYQGAELPKRRGDLYRDVFKMQLCDRPLAKGKEMDPPWSENQPILQGLALAMVQQNLSTISEAHLLEQLAPGLGEEAISPAGFLKQITEVSELLVERERQEYEFAHLSFQEYLAATEVEKQGLEGELLENYRESHWQGTIVLYAALTNPNRLLRGLIDKGTPEAAELAYKCLQETPRKVDEDLRVEVQKARLQELENLLANGKWLTADKETFRIMIRTVGKEKGQYFDLEDLDKFPCEELRELDRLWVKYSEGAWGFSVQKRVWQECGNPMSVEGWEKFCDRVEWRQGGNWVSYSDLQIKTEPKHTAQFPSKWATPSVLVGGGVVYWQPFLFSRAASCDL